MWMFPRSGKSEAMAEENDRYSETDRISFGNR